MDKIYKSVRMIEREYSEWIENYPDHYTYPIATANRILSMINGCSLKDKQRNMLQTEFNFLEYW